MTKITKQNTDRKDSWEIQEVRITLFPELNYVGKPENMWPKAFDYELEKVTTNSKSGQSILESSKNHRKLILAVNPFKFDLKLSTSEDLVPEQGLLMTLGSFEQVTSEHLQLSTKWLNSIEIESIKRVAFGANLVKRVSSLSEGYKILNQYLPFKIDASNSSDFRYQINKFTTSDTVKGLTINRLTRWAVLRVNLELFDALNPELVHRFPEIFAANLELDINTDQKFKKGFNKNKVEEIYRDLIKKGKDIADNGIR